MLNIDILIAIVLLLVGFVLLIKGADIFVEGSSNVAAIFGIPSVIVGLTIVAIGTSLPEAAVSISAALKGSNAIAVSNVVGSNLFNILVVLGLTSVIRTTKVNKDVIKRDLPYCIIVSFLLLIFCIDKVWAGNIIGKINIFNSANGEKVIGTLQRVEGMLLFFGFILYLFITVKSALPSINNGGGEKKDDDKKKGILKSIIFIVLGIAAIAIGGDFVVDNAKTIALAVGMSETLVGLTIVAVGTSLPELVTSLVAIKKGEDDIALGNVVGSNISNIVFVLGLSGLLNPIKISVFSAIDLMIVLIITCIVFVMAITGRKINRLEGSLGLVLYVLFMTYTIIR